MDEEIPITEHSSEPKLGSEPKPAFLPSDHIEYTKKIPDSEGRLERFFQRINMFFKRETQAPTPLQGRIHELQSNANAVLVHLMQAKGDLEMKSGDPAFQGLLNSVLDPFIKEVSRIQRAMDQDSTMAHQVKVSNLYSEWIEKAKWWAEACSQFESAEAACPVLLAHAVEEFHARIDRDIQVLQDYLNNGIQTLGLTSSFQKELKRRLSIELGLHLTALHQLKMVLPEETVEAFHLWRAEVDNLREKCFSDALHSIDAIFGDITPISEPPGNDDHPDETYPELRSVIGKLEAKLSLLAEQVEKADEMDHVQKKECLLHLLLLEEEANRLNSDLRLPTDQSDRLQNALEALATYRAQMES